MKNYIDVIYSFEDCEQLRTTIILDEFVGNTMQSERTMSQFLLQVLDIHFSFRSIFGAVQEVPTPLKVSMCVYSDNEFLVLPKWYNEESGKTYFNQVEDSEKNMSFNLN